MMKIYQKLTIFCLLLGSIASSAWATDFNPLPPGKWWENERLTKEIGLTKEQQAKIHDVVYQHAMGMIDLNAAVKRAELELGDLVDRPDFEAQAIRTAFTTFQQSRQALETSRFEMLLSVRQILSNEQWQRLQKLRRRFKMNHPEMQNNSRRGGPSESGRNRRTPRPQGG